MENQRTVKFKAGYWRYEETSSDELHILLGGLTEDLKTVFVRIKGFTPFVYLQLPERIKWNRGRCQKVFDYFKTSLKSNAPLKFTMETKRLLYYQEKVKVMMMPFPTQKACRIFSYKCAKGRISIPGIGTFSGEELRVHEQNIDPIIKFTCCQNILLSGWVEVKEQIPEDEVHLSVEERHFTTADIDMEAHWRNVQPAKAPKDVVVNPKYCSFDIECYSKNHNSKLPDPKISENVVFQISMVFGRFGESEKEKILLTLHDPLDIPGTKVYRFPSEQDLLLGFTSLVQEKDPDVMLGYNIMKFDWNYMIARSVDLGIFLLFGKLSRVIGERAVRKTQSWSSSAYGKQEFEFFDPSGRSNVDVLLEVERNYKLPKYSLNRVSEFFLKKHKEDIAARELFMLYQLTDELLKQTENLSPVKFRVLRERALEILEERRIIGKLVQDYRKEVAESTMKTFRNVIRKALQLTGIYCVQDTILPIELVDKLVLWTTMEEMSNCMHIPASYLHTRGQQIKVLAQVYRETLSNNLIIPFHRKRKGEENKEKYQGAIVIEANPGFYTNVATLDFAALYPTTMIAYNICYTTLLKPDDPTPDSECHVLEWEDHVGCEHDPQKRKKKKSEILCKKHRYRFRKVKIVISDDGRIERRHEGRMPRLERRLLSERKAVKKELFKIQARLKMHRGEADDDDIKKWREWGWEILEKGQLSDQEEKILEVRCNVLNARQLALKVSANSMYGSMGARNGFIPFIPGAASITAMGRWLITKAIERVLSGWDCAKLVYGDTDSCMLSFRDKIRAEAFDIGEKISPVVTHYLKCCILGVPEDFTVKWTDPGTGRIEDLSLDKVKSTHHSGLSKEDLVKVIEYQDNPIDLEFENMYGKFLLLTKKRYIAYVINKKGDVVAITKKGVVLARRDNCDYVRKAYKHLSTSILDEKDETEVMNSLYDHIHKLFTRQVPDKDLIIYVGVKDIKEYAKKETSDEVSSENNRFIDRNGNPIDAKIEDPLDPRLVYRNIPQCLLGLKMIRRGDSVPPNTRLEIIYLRNPEAEHQGDKAEDFTYYKENRLVEKLIPNYLLYLEKKLSNPVTELLSVRFPKTPVPYEKLDDALNRVMLNIEGPRGYHVANVKKFKKERPGPICYDFVVGWEVLGLPNPSTVPEKFDCYSFRGKAAKVEYILDSAKREGPLELDSDSELVQVCKRWKARQILNKLYRQKGITIRASKRPYQNGLCLPRKMKIMLLRGHQGFPRGSLGQVVSCEKEETGTGVQYLYTLLMDKKGTVIKNVPRTHITTYLLQDGTIMKDILKAREYYQRVVFHLEALSSFVKSIE